MNRRGKVLSGESRQIIYNVIKCMDREKRLEELTHPLNMAVLRAAKATGVCINTICKIKKEGKQADLLNEPIPSLSKGKRGKLNKRVQVDSFDLSAIRQIIAYIYDVKKEIPTLGAILEMAKKDLGFKGCKGTLNRLLKQKLGFHFKKCVQNKKVLLEALDIKTCRVKYLRRLRNNDALEADKKPVIYLDEVWIDMLNLDGLEYSADFTSISLKKDSPGQKWIVINAGNEDGFVKGAGLLIKAKTKKDDSYDELGSNDFYRYVKEKLIPNLPNSCIIAMDNAPYHNVEIDKPPSYKHTKNQIKDWMVRHLIQFDEDWTKPELLMHIKKNLPEKRYAVDQLLQDHGHEVLRIPFYCNLNPMEHIWQLLKARLAELKSELPDTKVEVLVTQAMSSITKDDWTIRVNHVKRFEEEYWNRDVILENDFEELITKEEMLSDSAEDNVSSPDASMDEEDDEAENERDDKGAGKYMMTIAPLPDRHKTGGPSVKIKTSF